VPDSCPSLLTLRSKGNISCAAFTGEIANEYGAVPPTATNRVLTGLPAITFGMVAVNNAMRVTFSV